MRPLLVFRGDSSGPIQQDKIVGTAFSISADSLLTNYHVVQDCNSITIGQHGKANLIGHNSSIDVALLRLEQRLGDNQVFASFRRAQARLGEQVVVFGYPDTTVMSEKGTVAVGVIGSLSGLKDDINDYQIMVPVHPGNSGSPLLDSNGFVIGVVSGKLRPDINYELVGYAVKSNIVLSFLEANRVRVRMGNEERGREVPDIVDEVSQYTFPIRCSPKAQAIR